MAVTTYSYNAFKEELFSGLSTSAQDFEVMLTIGYTPDNENNISEISPYEVSLVGTNYARQNLASVVISRDDVNNRMKISCDDNVWDSAIFAADGAVIFINNGSDLTSIPVVYFGFGEVKSSDNTEFELDWNDAEGAMYLE